MGFIRVINLENIQEKRGNLFGIYLNLKAEDKKGTMHYTHLLKIICDALYDPRNDTTETIKHYFHPQYEQCINGVYLRRDEYIHHVEEQKKNMTINAIDYKHVLEKENELFALYYITGVNKNNLPIEAEVIAYFLFEKQQVLRIHGQVRLIKGDYADVDMKNS